MRLTLWHGNWFLRVGLALLVGFVLLHMLALHPRSTSQPARFTMLFGSQQGITVAIGPQSLCPPIMACPPALRQPAGIRMWWVEGPTDWMKLSAKQAMPLVRHQQLLYLKLPASN